MSKKDITLTCRRSASKSFLSDRRERMTIMHDIGHSFGIDLAKGQSCE